MALFFNTLQKISICICARNMGIEHVHKNKLSIWIATYCYKNGKREEEMKETVVNLASNFKRKYDYACTKYKTNILGL
jgi:hypothetical protein